MIFTAILGFRPHIGDVFPNDPARHRHRRAVRVSDPLLGMCFLTKTDRHDKQRFKVVPNPLLGMCF